MTSFINQLLFGINNYNNNQKILINELKNDKIIKITIFRKPINKMIKQALNVLSFGKFLRNLKNSNYDDIYHLYMIIYLDNNLKLLLEKNERINLVKINDIEILKFLYNSNSQNMDVVLNNNELKLIDLLNNTYQNMGSNYFKYSSNQYNCQNFIYNILKSNNLLTNQLELFLYQDPTILFHKINYLTKFNNIITDIGARLDLIKRGSGIKDNNINKIIIDNKKYKFNSNKNKNKRIKLMNDDIIIVYYE